MPEITRRRLLKTAGVAAGGAMATSVLPQNLRQALAAGPRHGSLRDVKHVVIHMQENRSFDHYFGTLAGVRGFGDPDAITLSTGKSVFYQPDSQNPDGYLLPFHLDTKKTSSQAIPSTSHAWTVQHSAVNGGANDNWLPAHLAADGPARGWYTMGYYERDDIPFHFALAENFTICDGYHCSLLGPTWPNRMYLMSGTIDPQGKNGGPIISNVIPSPYTWTTYPERLEAAGISWRIYQEEDDYGTNVLEWFQQYQDARPGTPLYDRALKIHPPDRFEYDARKGKLPTVSWIVPTSGQSEHPAYIPAAGADYLASKLEAVASNRDLWSKTVFIINYDENDGLFDHVPPPLPPAGTPDEFVSGLPIGGGVRVPCIIVSPWTVGGWVASEKFDHTSVLQLLESFTGVREPNISAWRRATFGDLTSALGFSRGSSRFPSLPNTKSEFQQAERELATLPAATLPGADQTPPVQQKRRPPLRWGGYASAAAISGSAKGRVAFPGTAGRLDETLTSHRGDFPRGTKGTSFPGRLAAVVGRATSAAVRHAYVPGIAGGSVAVIDTTTYAIASAIHSQTNPYGIAALPDASKIYVTESGTNVVSVIDPGANTVLSSITVGVYPHGIAASPDGKQIFVANTGPDTGPGGSDTVSVIDTATDEVDYTVRVGQAPQMVACSPDGSLVWVSCHDGISVIDVAGRHVSAVHGQPALTHGMAPSPDGRVVYVADSTRDRVLVIHARSRNVLGRIPVGETPWNVAFTADGSAAYVTNANEDTVSVIDPTRRAVVATIGVGHIPTGITAGDGVMWVANNTSSTISVIDVASNRVIETIELGLSDEPTEIALA